MRLSKNSNINTLADSFVEVYSNAVSEVKNIDAYNKKYLEKYLEKIRYNAYIAASLIEDVPNKDQLKTIIDLGGGIGFNSAFFAFLGYKTYYLDLDAKSVEDAQKINSKLNLDITYLHGSIEDYQDLLKSNVLLCSRDVIEHIYNLTTFFEVSKKAGYNVHNTAAVYGSLFRSSEFKAIHHRAEHLGNNSEVIKQRDQRNPYRSLRKTFIETKELKDGDSEILTDKTRGLTYTDMEHYLKTKTYPKHHLTCLHTNTCDPSTGNWAERLLSPSDYHLYASDAGINVSIKYLKYNALEAKGVKSIIINGLNILSSISKLHSLQASFNLVY